jgi:hypothetical protein
MAAQITEVKPLTAVYRLKVRSAANERRQNANAERMRTGWPVG